MICVECGVEAERLIDGCCAACFAKGTQLMLAPEVIDLELCAHCNARHVGAHWVQPDASIPLDWLREDAVRGAIQVHARVGDAGVELVERAETERHFRYTVAMNGHVEEVPVTAQASLLLRVTRGVCERCSRMAGGYYAAIIQLRATERDVTEHELGRAHRYLSEELDRQQDTGNRMAFLSKSGAIHGGYDYYIGDIDAARAVARVLQQRLGASTQETAKLVGRREGEDVYRVTFLVRIRLFAPGDFALSDKTPVQVHSIARGNASCVDLLHHRKMKVPEKTLRRLGGLDIIQEAILVSQDASGLQVLDPVTLRTQDLLRPDGWAGSAETVPVLRIDDRLYVAPSTG